MRHKNWTVIAATAALMCGTAAAAQTTASTPDVRLDTEAGAIIIDLDYEHAPVTACHFAQHVVLGDYQDGDFFRSVVAATNDNPNPIDVIQAATVHGSDDATGPSIPLERTSDTGLSHVAGVVSMARDGPDTATTSFFIVTQDTPSLDFGGGRNPDGQGFGAFGRVVEGLDVARAIQAMPTDGEEQLTPPVRITAAVMLAPAPESCRP